MTTLAPFDLHDVYRKTFSGSADSLIEEVSESLSDCQFVWVSFVYFATLQMTGWYTRTPEPKYQRALSLADFILADGIAFRLLQFAHFHPQFSGREILLNYKSFSKQAVPNLNGTDLTPKLLKRLEGQGVRLVIYGATPEVSAKAADKVRRDHAFGVQAAHGYAPFPFQMIDGTDPVVLLVGLGAPKQEQWILEHRSKFEARGNIVVMGVGGLFDFWAGAETRAPVWIQNSGLEWLWRLVTFPRKNSKKAIASLNFFKQLLFPQVRSQG